MTAVSRRLVLFFPGFEPLDGEAHYRRFARAAEMTGRVWDRHIGVSSLERDDALPSFMTTSIEDDAVTVTKVVIGDLAPVMRLIASRSALTRISSGFVALGSFVLNGTLLGYFRTSWRYGLFFLYPLFLAAVVLTVGYFVGRAVSGLEGVFAGLALSWGLFLLACRYAHFLLMMDLWHYARVLATGVDPEVRIVSDLLVGESKRRVLAETDVFIPGEILLCGHSIGAALAVRLAAELLAKSQPSHVLTLGSGLLQVACHPKATELRAMAARLLDAQVYWLDVQALIDPINFLDSDLAQMYSTPSKNYREIVVRMRHLLSPSTYRRIKFNLFRVHRQYVLPVEIKQRFSFHVMISGATAFPDIVRLGGLPEACQEERLSP
jgi:hypothetical protein